MSILCPKCTEVMMIVERQGIHIDYCQRCHGVFLDRGELEKMIQLSLQPLPAYQQPVYPQHPHQQVSPQQAHRRNDHDDYDYRYNGKKKRRSFLGDIFDFD
ncbi:MAG: zf-TFIIB domain-containing protein [Armatimonadota bacterium]